MMRRTHGPAGVSMESCQISAAARVESGRRTLSSRRCSRPTSRSRTHRMPLSYRVSLRLSLEATPGGVGMAITRAPRSSRSPSIETVGRIAGRVWRRREGIGKALVMVPLCSLGPRTGQVASNALLLCVALRSSNQRTNRSSDSSRMWHSYRWAEGKEALPVLTEEKQPAGGTSRARPLPLGRMPGVSAGSWCPERTPLGQWELVVA